MRAVSSKKTKDMSQFHRNLVHDLLAQTKPAPEIQKAGVQWGLWLLASLGTMGLILTMLKLQPGVGSVLNQMPSMTFLGLAFLGSALAAWEAISSSVPGRQTPRGYRIFLSLILIFLFLMPFLFFASGGHVFNPWTAFRDGWGCFSAVSLIGFFPWIFLGWIVSRNAAFHPGWTGAWTGASAFLLSSMTIQLHCPNWQAGHMLMAHLLPVAIFTLATSWLGAHWFSRWRK
jgi:hypothetical protein